MVVEETKDVITEFESNETEMKKKRSVFVRLPDSLKIPSFEISLGSEIAANSTR
jgi:hypothetical protein